MSIDKENIKPIEKHTRVIKLAKHPDGKFIITPRSYQRDMPYKCWGLYSWLMGLMPNQKITVSYAAEACSMTKVTARKLLKEIQSAGYALGSCETGNYIALEFNINEVDEDTRKRLENHVKSLERTSKQTDRATKKHSEKAEEERKIFWSVVNLWNKHFEGHSNYYGYKDFDAKLFRKIKVQVETHSLETIDLVFWYARKEADGVIFNVGDGRGRWEEFNWTLSGVLSKDAFQLLHGKAEMFWKREQQAKHWRETQERIKSEPLPR